MSLFDFCYVIFLAISSCSQVGTIGINLMHSWDIVQVLRKTTGTIRFLFTLFSLFPEETFLLPFVGQKRATRQVPDNQSQRGKWLLSWFHDFLTSLFYDQGKSWQWLLIKKPIISATLMNLNNITFGCF